MSNKIVLLSGVAGSGKSTKAKELCREKNRGEFVILSTDALLTHGDHYLWSGDTCGPGHFLLGKLCNEAMRRKVPLIIIDNTNLTFGDVAQYFVLAIDNQYELDIIEPDTPWRYDAQELFKRNTHNVPLEAIERMLNRRQTVESLMNQYNNKIKVISE